MTSTRPSLPVVPATETIALPTVAALEGIWKELHQKTVWSPRRLFSQLKFRWQVRRGMVDAARVQRIAPLGKVNDCRACTNLCCIGDHAAVLLRFQDIATLIDIGRTDLISHQKPRFSSETLASRPALARQVRSDAWQTFPVLSRTAFGACVALTDEGRCGLYPHWPLACARFPYALHLDDESVFYSRRCDAFWIHPAKAPEQEKMVHAAVRAYNHRVRDLVMLAYAPDRLAELGLLRFIRSPASPRSSARQG